MQKREWYNFINDQLNEKYYAKDKQRCHSTQGLSCRRGALWRKNKQYRKKGYCYHLQRKALHSSSGLYTE